MLSQEHTAEFVRALSPTSRFSQLSIILGTDRFESFYRKIIGAYKYIDENLLEKENELKRINEKTVEKQIQLDEEKLIVSRDKIENEEEYIKSKLLEFDDNSRLYFPNFVLDKVKLRAMNLEELVSFGVNYCKEAFFKIAYEKNELERQITELEQSSKKYSNIDLIVEKSKKLNIQLNNIDANLAKNKTETDTRENKLNVLKEQEEKFKFKVNKLNQELKLISELKTSVGSYLKNKLNLQKLDKETEVILGKINDHFSNLKGLNKNLANVKRLINEHEGKIKTFDKEIEKLAFLKNNLPIILNLDKSIAQSMEKSKVIEEKLQHKLKETQDTEAEWTKCDNLRKLSQKDLDALLARHDEYRGLLNKIRSYIKNSLCPTCGHDWGSKEALKKHIEELSELQDKEIVIKQQENTKLLKEREEIDKRLSLYKGELENIKKEVQGNHNNLEIAKLKKKELIKQLRQLGLTEESVQEYAEQRVNKEIEEANNQRESIGIKLAEVSQQKKEIETKNSLTESMISECERMKVLNQQNMKSIQRDLTTYEEKAQSFNLVARDITEGVLNNLIKETQNAIAKVEETKRNITVSLAKETQNLDNSKKQLLELGQERHKIELEKAKYEAIIADYKRMLSNFTLMKFSDMKKAILEKTEKLKNISKLNERGNVLLQIVQYVGGHKKRRSLREEIAMLDGQKQMVEKELEVVKQSRKFAERLNRKAREETAQIVDKLIKGHETLINAFYSQINAHPFFKSIHFKIDRIPGRGGGNAIFIEAIDEYQEKRINPSLTFSSAQLNVLAISIFLAIHSKQVWSTLDSILMDDPIQNMDDLNILSYIDLIRRICREKQIIISTHDDSIYRLMYRKLYPVNGEKLICYDYIGIGEDGPEIKVQRA